jgi:uroporphyrinogen-III synthase
MTRAQMDNARDLSGLLGGACVVVTRPAGSGAALARNVRALGGTPLLLPGLAVRAVGDDASALRALHAARQAQLCIFTSPAAVRFAFRLLPALSLPTRAVMFGIGDGTRTALARHGLAAHAPSRRADSEGLLALPELADVRGRRIALIGAPGGRDLIAPTLRRRGAEVDAIHVYERVPPRLTRRHFSALAAAAEPLITLLSSGEALRNLGALLPADLLARLRRQALVVSSSRLAALAHTAGFTDVSVADSASPRDLLASASRRLARHRL